MRRHTGDVTENILFGGPKITNSSKIAQTMPLHIVTNQESKNAIADTGTTHNFFSQHHNDYIHINMPLISIKSNPNSIDLLSTTKNTMSSTHYQH